MSWLCPQVRRPNDDRAGTPEWLGGRLAPTEQPRPSTSLLLVRNGHDFPVTAAGVKQQSRRLDRARLTLLLRNAGMSRLRSVGGYRSTIAERKRGPRPRRRPVGQAPAPPPLRRVSGGGARTTRLSTSTASTAICCSAPRPPASGSGCATGKRSMTPDGPSRARAAFCSTTRSPSRYATPSSPPSRANVSRPRSPRSASSPARPMTAREGS